MTDVNIEITGDYYYNEEVVHNHSQEYFFNNNKILIFFSGEPETYRLEYVRIDKCDKDFNIFLKTILDDVLIKDFSLTNGVYESLLEEIKNVLSGLCNIDNLIYSEYSYTLTLREITYHSGRLYFRNRGALTFEYDLLNKCFIHKAIEDWTYETYIIDGVVENYRKNFYKSDGKEKLPSGYLLGKQTPFSLL